LRVVAFDLSLSATGWACSDQFVEWGVFTPPNMRDIQRIDWISRQCVEWARAASLVVMEDFAYSQNAQGAREIAGVAYMVRHFLWKHDIPYVVVGTSSLKKFVVGHGGSSKNPVAKSAIVKEVFKRWNHDTFDDNAADAIGLLYVGRALIGDWTPTIEPQREVIAALAKKFPNLPKVA
jgi:Holliday junction resolvasome RuvABC endonuclease subunit